MNVFYVGDNRNSPNWGRGASIALAQLLSGAFQITGRVSGNLFVLSLAEVGYVNTLLRPRHYEVFLHLWNHRNFRPFRWYIKLEQWLGARDFIAEDPEESVDNLLAHKGRYPGLARIFDQAAAADLLVIDGDGDIVFTTPPRRQTLFLLAMIELGIRLKKPVFLVNSMISDCPTNGQNKRTVAVARKLFGQCRGVALRDPESIEYARREMPEVHCSYFPDSLFAWHSLYQEPSAKPPPNGDFLLPHPEKEEYWGKLDFSRPYVCIGGGAASSCRANEAVASYKKLVEGIKELGLAVYLTENDEADSFLRKVALETNVGLVPAHTPILMCGAVLANARLFISGRYHPSIFASLGGTPCIFLASHAHKMESLPRVLEYDEPQRFSAVPTDAEIKAIISAAKAYLAQGEPLRARIRSSSKARCDEVRQLPAFIQQRMAC